MTGVVVGKFYPPHSGHKLLIETALAQSERLIVIVCDAPGQDPPAWRRAEWLREIHPAAEVVVTPDDIPDAPGPWAERTIQIVGCAPDAVFSSEDYGAGYAAAMGCRHVMADRERKAIPVSARQIRADPFSHWHFMEPCVRQYYVVRVVLIGVESTGKTTLSVALAETFGTAWVPEYGREYALGRSRWETEDFIHIARVQKEREDAAARQVTGLLICDTNAFATCIWHRRYMGAYSPGLDEIGLQDKVRLYLYAQPDFPFVQDGTRDGEHIRTEMNGWFEQRLATQPAPVLRLAGPFELRLHAASTEITRRFPLLTPH